MSNNIKIMALGGLGEVGKNCYVIEYKNSLYVIDFGVLFANQDQLGIDFVIPNFTYLKENQDRIKGLWITHGHEDHIGAIPFLLKNVSIPVIYSPAIAAEMIKRKLKEHKINQKIVQINDSNVFKYGDLKISLFRQTHSIPDSYGLIFESPIGKIVHTGDFKVDFSPPGQKTADFLKMANVGADGVLCLLSDSTNAMVDGFSLSESIVGQNIKSVIKNAEGRIILSTFASNMNRVQQMIEGCIENNRQIAIVGRSLDNGIKIGSKIGYIKTKNHLINIKNINNYKPEEVAIICTGSQGENLAALSRIANGLNPNVQLTEEDTIVFASNPIPGNTYQVGQLVDAITRSGAKVIKNSKINQIHASGHASKEEQKLLLTLFKPKYFMPIHGNFTMLLNHAKTAELLGITRDNSFLLDNGDALIFDINQKPEIIKNYTDGRSMFVSGTNITTNVFDANHSRLSRNGFLVLSIAYSPENKKILSKAQVTTRGFIHINESLDLIRAIRFEFLNNFKKIIKKENETNIIADKLKSQMIDFISNKKIGIPEISIHLIPIENIHDKRKKIQDLDELK